MKKIDLTPYNVTVLRSSGEKEEVPYLFKDSLTEILFNRELKLNGVALVKQNILAEKILKFEGDILLLEDEEYDRVVRAITVVEGLGKNDVIFCQRILNAETI